MDKPLYQLRDSESLEYGLITTNCPDEKVKELWVKYYNEDFEENDTMPQSEDWAEDISADGFADYLVQLGFEAERVYTYDIYAFTNDDDELTFEISESAEIEVCNFDEDTSWIRWNLPDFSDNGNIDLPRGHYKIKSRKGNKVTVESI